MVPPEYDGLFPILREDLFLGSKSDFLRHALAWFDGADALRSRLAAMPTRVGETVPEVPDGELQGLYLLSILGDVLLQSHAPPLGERTREFPVDAGSLDCHREFMQALGCVPAPAVPFTPVLHEIVTVEQSADPDEPISLVEEPYWPGWMMGDMVFCRAGVRVRGGTRHIVKDIAENSMIYFTFSRSNRPAFDTTREKWWKFGCSSFRRDFYLDGRAWYNMHVFEDPEFGMMADDGFTPSKTREVVRHRHFVRCPKPDDDMVPDYDSLVEPAFGPWL